MKEKVSELNRFLAIFRNNQGGCYYEECYCYRTVTGKHQLHPHPSSPHAAINTSVYPRVNNSVPDKKICPAHLHLLQCIKNHGSVWLHKLCKIDQPTIQTNQPAVWWFLYVFIFRLLGNNKNSVSYCMCRKFGSAETWLFSLEVTTTFHEIFHIVQFFSNPVLKILNFTEKGDDQKNHKIKMTWIFPVL